MQDIKPPTPREATIFSSPIISKWILDTQVNQQYWTHNAKKKERF